MPVLGLGTDVVSVPRFASALERHGERLLRRVFTEGEIAYVRTKAQPAVYSVEGRLLGPPPKVPEDFKG